MTKNYKCVKIEIKPTGEQIEKINKTIGTGRYLYNFYITYNKEIYEKEKKFVTGFEFSKYINNIFIKENPDKVWIKDVSSKSNKRAIMEVRKHLKDFLKNYQSFQNLKRKIVITKVVIFLKIIKLILNFIDIR